MQFSFSRLSKDKKMTEKLGEKALQAMKEMNTAVVEFKMPTVPKSKKGHMKILSEEQYIEVCVPLKIYREFYLFFICL